MPLPLGDILRALVPSKWGFVRAILEAVKGTKITTKGGTEILLDQRPGIPSDLSNPHDPSRPTWGRR